MKHLSAFLMILILYTLFFVFRTPTAEALTMSDSNFILHMGTAETAGGKSSGGGNNLTVSIGQTSPGLYSGTNYKVRSGFQYIYSIIPFGFSIDNTTIDFGTLSATNPITRTNILTVSNGSANGYQVTAYENHQLLNPGNGKFIPDTTCDSGTPCTESASGTWSSVGTFGFGYRCDVLFSSGGQCANGFTSANAYKQFADNSLGETPQIISQLTTANQATRSAQLQITYKVNISGTQPAGVYSNVITYIATPSY